MKKIFKTFLIAILMQIVLSASCYSAVLNNTFVKSEIEKAVKDKIKNKFDGDVSVQVSELPYKSFDVPSGKVSFDVGLNLNYLNSRTLVRVNLKVEGLTVKSFGIPVEIKIEDYVWVVTERIDRGKSFNSSNIKLEKKDITSKFKDVAKKDFKYEDFFTGKAYRPGDFVTMNFVEGIPDVMQNSPVTVIFETDNLSLVIDAEAMDSGKIGDYIKVRSRQYKKDYMGKIINPNQILVKM